MCAVWKTVDELKELETRDQLRGDELLKWAQYLENGGHVYPMQMFSPEKAQAGVVDGSASFNITSNLN